MSQRYSYAFEPYTFDEHQSHDKAFYQEALSPWQKANPKRLRINSDTDGEIGNAVCYEGLTYANADGSWSLSDSVGAIKLDFNATDDWKKDCGLAIRVIKNNLFYFILLTNTLGG